MNNQCKSVRKFLLLIVCLLLWPEARAATVFQAANAEYVAWEAEDALAIVNNAPTTWVASNDAPASGGRALYSPGANQTGSPASFVSYAIRFRMAGDYTLYLRWRADRAFTDLDPNSGNSYYRPNSFGDLGPDVANYTTSSINNSRTPPDVNNYAMGTEAAIYTVTQEQVDAGLPLILKLGTREAGLYIDRIVLSLNPLAEPDFNALTNSDTEVIPQGATEEYVAFEAERVTGIANGAPTAWDVVNDATASGTQALYASGSNGTAAPASFATYTIRFRQPGDYTLYLRWRADRAFTDLDPNSGNSYFRPNSFGDLGPDVANYANSSINNSRTPPDVNNYAMGAEATVYTVTQEQVDAGVPLILKLGTREAGLYIDRIVLSLNPLAESEFNALPNSGSVARPGLVKATGSPTLTTVRVEFDRPLAPGSVTPDKFTLSGGLTVTEAAFDFNTSKDVILTTTPQTQGTVYTVTVNDVTDVNGNAVAANSRINFTAWRLANGWITREIYANVVGNTIETLLAALSFPNNPSSLAFVRDVSIGADLQFANYGARFRGYFTPTQAGAYEFYLYGDDDALLSLSSDESPANLVEVLRALPASTAFDPSAMHTTGNLDAGRRYLFEVLYKQNTDSARLGLAARRVGTPGEVTALPLLGGSQVSTFVNPDAGAVTIASHPAGATVPAGQRARFTVAATAPMGGTLFYQWQRDGVDIPGANRPTYITPILTAADNQKPYRVVVSVNGTDVPSQAAMLTVGPAVQIRHEPYVGINFASGLGAGTTIGASLAPNDVAGAVLQENWNNVLGTTIDGTQPLVDAQGAASPITVAVWDPAGEFPIPANANIGTGTGFGNTSADHLLMQGSLANNNTALSILVGGIPAGNYALLAYSVGFSFNSTYEEDFELFGAETYPKLTVRAQTSTEFIANPTLVRMTSTNPEARDRGNYVLFDNVQPRADGTLLLTVTPMSATVGNTAYFPPLNAIQLVRIAATRPSIAIQRGGAGLTISWGADAAGFTLQSSATLGAGASWGPVAGTPNPITGAGSATVTPSGTAQFYVLTR